MHTSPRRGVATLRPWSTELTTPRRGKMCLVVIATWGVPLLGNCRGRMLRPPGSRSGADDRRTLNWCWGLWGAEGVPLSWDGARVSLWGGVAPGIPTPFILQWHSDQVTVSTRGHDRNRVVALYVGGIRPRRL